MYAELFVETPIDEQAFLRLLGVATRIGDHGLPATSVMDIEVKENWDQEADGFLGFPTLVQLESLPGVSEADFEKEVRAAADKVRGLGHQVVIAAPFCTEPAPP